MSTHHNGNDTPFGFRIPDTWPKWKQRCSATNRQGSQCGRWAVRGMPTCRFHGSGGERNAQLGLIRYLAWVAIGIPTDTPVEYARFAAMAAVLEMMFNHGKGSEVQRMQAVLWMMDVPNLGPMDIRSMEGT